MRKILIYTSRAIDNTMQHALNELCIAATKGTQETQDRLEHFLNYCATHPVKQKLDIKPVK